MRVAVIVCSCTNLTVPVIVKTVKHGCATIVVVTVQTVKHGCVIIVVGNDLLNVELRTAGKSLPVLFVQTILPVNAMTVTIRIV